MEKVEKWSRVKELFDAALERDAAERKSYLSRACGDDISLRAEVESLLLAYESPYDLSKAPWLASLNDHVTLPRTIGSYELVRRVGEGGMGEVWLAQQTAPVHRQVALKLIRSGMYEDAMLRRFQAECQSLAIMDHPAIARVFDAGTTAEGQPYFCMEYVPGIPLLDYCDQKKLNLHERLELFILACDGVQHAHQKAIVHRDLKPANILVVEVDGKPTPRIIDFGLAKAVASASNERSMLTQAGILVGTLAYMSPEQADPGAADVDTRSDIYSLGVVLYQLLCGALPHDCSRKRPLDQVLRELREADPAPPSARITDRSSDAAYRRATEPKRLARQLRGDLDSIVLKAIEKDRARRYGTVAELAADIRRYLENKPVQARAAASMYRLSKYLLRHRAGVAVTAFALILLTGFAVVQSIQLRRITRERDRANRVAQFMTDMFRVADPTQLGPNITVREMLDKGSSEIGTGLAKEPAIQAPMLHIIGNAYSNLGLYTRAEPLLERSVLLAKSSLGPDDPETLLAMEDVGVNLVSLGRYAEAEKIQREALQAQRRTLGAENSDTLRTASDLAITLSSEGHLDEAASLNRQILAIDRRVLGEGHRYTLATMNNLATMLAMQGKLGEAEQLQREAANVDLQVMGPENLMTIGAFDNLAETLVLSHRDEEAEKILVPNLAAVLRLMGPNNQETAQIKYDLGRIAAHRGLREQALRLVGQAVKNINLQLAAELSSDPELKALHGDPRFDEIVAVARKRLEQVAHEPNQ